MAVLPSRTRTNLPDSAFAAVWTDSEGRKQRKLPYRHADGSIDLPHLRNALARISQTDMPSSVRGKARRKLESAKERHMSKLNTLTKAFNAFVHVMKEAEGAYKEGEAEGAMKEAEGAAPAMHPTHLDALRGHVQKLTDAIAAYGEAELPAEHPVHSLKALHKEMSDYLKEAESACKEAEGESEAEGEAEAEAEGEMPEGHVTKSKVNKREVELAKKLESVEKALGEQIEKAALAEQSAELRKFRGVSVNPETDAPIFKSLKTVQPETYARVMEILKAADESVATSGVLTSTLGSPNAGAPINESAWAEIEKEAESLVQKSETKLTKAQAIDVVMKKRPDLVKRHLDAVAGNQ